MPNSQIENKQLQIESACEFVRSSRMKIADYELQLQNLQQGSQFAQQKSALLRLWDDEMDLLDDYLASLEGVISSYQAIQDIQNFGQLQAQFINLKTTQKNSSLELKKAKEGLTKIEALEKRATLELNTTGHQNFLTEIDLKILASQQKLDVLYNQKPTNSAAITLEQTNLASLQAQRDEKVLSQAAKVQALVVIGQNKSSQIALIGQISSSLSANIQSLNQNLQEISNLNDPRYLVNTFNDNTPFLLLPVRVETRYMDIKHVRRVIPADTAPGFSIPDKKELWVRIFPDDIAIHTHESRLTADEEHAGQTYWTSIWEAGILEEGIDPQLSAWRVLSGAYGPQRAAWIAKQTKPTNIEFESHPIPPVFPTLELKLSAWSEAAKSYVLPDRFVVRLYTDEFTYREVVGSHIPDPLQVGMNPTEELESAFDQHEGEVKFPDEIKWLRDFNEAKAIGMGISIPLEPEEQVSIHRILVLGLKLSANKSEATQLVEDLIENHHYTTGGFSLIPQGTPTNNTEGSKSGYERIVSDAKESLKIEGKGSLFTAETDLLEKSDGQWFADLMGVDYSVVENVFHANGSDVGEAIAMNRALWPATMGYFIKQMLQPHVSNAERKRVREFFNKYVLGRGRIPAFRVDNQPYGVITSTAFSRWKYTGSLSVNESFYKRLYDNVLKPMSSIWDGLVSENVKNVNIHLPTTDPSQRFLDILGLHASSVEFHQRFANGAHKMWNLYRFIRDSNPGVGPVDLPPDFPIISDDFMGDYLTYFNSELALSMAEPPKLFELNFLFKQRLLNGPVIDGFTSFPYSEIRGIQTFPDTEWNYIHWLTANSTTISKIRAEEFDNIPGITLPQKPPKALLYLLLRHAYLQEYLNTSTGILIAAGKATSEADLEIELQGIVNQTNLSAEEKAIVLKAVTEEVTIAMKLQIKQQVIQEFQNTPNVARYQIRAREGQLFTQAQTNLQQQINTTYNARLGQYKANQLKWDYLTQPVVGVSGTDSMEVHILGLLSSGISSTDGLAQVKDALEKLKGLPTARLERAFAEHLDLCNYRLDAWMTGLVSERLESQQSSSKGVYLGAFGILENLKPNTSNPGIHVVEVDGNKNVLSTSPAVTNAFNYIGDKPPITLTRDPENGKIKPNPRVDAQNQGFVHTPSINHAVTAAILRAGYLSHKESGSDDDTLAINLTSSRVRRALYYLEGIQNGQSLAAMLGYRFERELHDKSSEFGDFAETNVLDKYILDFRLAYPLTTGAVIPKDETVSVENQEANNVVDGLALINDYDSDPTIITDLLDSLEVELEEEVTAIISSIDQIQNDMDAIADLLLSESVYQLAKGNLERSGAVLKILGEGGYIQEPEIIKTPRQGAALTHKFGIQFDQEISSHAIWTINGTPRSFSEPSLNGWLSAQLPSPGLIVFNVEYDTVSYDGEGLEIITVNSLQLTLNDLEIEPIDFIYLMGDQGGSQDAAELSTRIAFYIVKNEIESDGFNIRISYTETAGLSPDEFSLFQILPLVKEIKTLIGNSRPINYEDFLLAADAQIVTPPLVADYLAINQTSERLKKVAGLTAGFDGNLTSLLANLTSSLASADALIYPLDPLLPIDPANGTALENLRLEILKCAFFGVQNVYPSSVFDFSEIERDNLVSIGTRLKNILADRLAQVTPVLNGLALLTTIKEINQNLTKAGQILFGRVFKVYPNFELLNPLEVDLTRSGTNLLDEVGDMAVEEWMQGVAKVKSKIGNYQRLRLYSDSLTSSLSAEMVVTQLPVPLPIGAETTDDVLERMRWIGMTLPEDYDVPGDNLSLVLELPSSTDPSSGQAGMILDEWVEIIPYKNVHTGVAMHYNEPNAEAPNTLIMAVTPEETGQWRWDDLMDTLNDTLSLARKRAVEPDHIKKNDWGQALPALISAISPNDSTPSLDFARNIVDADNGQYGYIAPSDFAVE